MSNGVRILRAADAETHDRGSGVRTIYLVTAEVASADFTTGTTEFAPAAELGFHVHNCAESVLVLEGTARFDHDDTSDEMTAGDATFVPAGVAHRFVNIGRGTMRIYFVYGSEAPTRTMRDTGETYAVGSARDVVSSKGPPDRREESDAS